MCGANFYGPESTHEGKSINGWPFRAPPNPQEKGKSFADFCDISTRQDSSVLYMPNT